MKETVTRQDIWEDEMLLNETGREHFTEIRKGAWVMYDADKKLILPLKESGKVLTYSSKTAALNSFFGQSRAPDRSQLTTTTIRSGLCYCTLPVGLCKKGIPCEFYIERIDDENRMCIQQMALNILLEQFNFRIF